MEDLAQSIVWRFHSQASHTPICTVGWWGSMYLATKPMAAASGQRSLACSVAPSEVRPVSGRSRRCSLPCTVTRSASPSTINRCNQPTKATKRFRSGEPAGRLSGWLAHFGKKPAPALAFSSSRHRSLTRFHVQHLEQSAHYLQHFQLTPALAHSLSSRYRDGDRRDTTQKA